MNNSYVSNHFYVNSYSSWVVSSHFSEVGNGAAFFEVLVFDEKLALAHYYLDDYRREVFSLKPTMFYIDDRMYYCWIGMELISFESIKDFINAVSAVSPFYPYLLGVLHNNFPLEELLTGHSIQVRDEDLIVKKGEDEFMEFEMVFHGKAKGELHGISIEKSLIDNIFCARLMSQNLSNLDLRFSRLDFARKKWIDITRSGLLLHKILTLE